MESDEVAVVPRPPSNPQIYERLGFCARLAALRAFGTVCFKSNAESHIRPPLVLTADDLGGFGGLGS